MPQSLSHNFKTAIEKFDSMNAMDSNKTISNGEEVSATLLESKSIENWISKFTPEPSEALLLAAHCQHLCRWEIPRSQFPDGRSGYLKWRSTLAVFHAKKAEEVLNSLGYSDAIVQRVHDINLKKNLKKDIEVQIMEDALCLVFLQFQAEEFAKKHPEEKIIDIIRKTWEKMSEQGRAEALKLDFSPSLGELINRALAA